MPAPERKEPQLPQSEANLNRALRRLGEALGPYVARKTNDDTLKETRDVYAILSKMLIPPATWTNCFQAELGNSGRGYVNQLRDFRNGPWAHQDIEGYDDNDVLHILYSIAQLLRAISAPEQADEVQQWHNELIPLIAGLGAPVRPQPSSEYAELQQRLQEQETERRQLSDFIMTQLSRMTQPTSQPESGLSPHAPVSQPPAAPADSSATTPINPNIRQPDYFVKQGNAALNQQDYDHAIECYNRALELNPSLAEALKFPLATAYKNRGDAHAYEWDDQAIADFTKALELNPDDAEVYSNRGDAYARIGEYDLAIADFTETLELNPDDAGVYSNRGDAYARIGEYDLAIADFTEALELNPDDEFIREMYALTYIRRGHAYGEKGEYDLAIADYVNARELDPDIFLGTLIPRDNFGRSALSSVGANFDLDVPASKEISMSTVDDFTKALELNPDDAMAYIHRGDAYADIGEYDQAIADYTKALELNPGDAEVYAKRGGAYAKIGEYDQVIDDYTEALKLDPDNAEVYKERGAVYFRLDEYDLAIADYAKALELNPDDEFIRRMYARTYIRRGHVYARKEEYDLAIADYTKALELDPDDAFVYAHRGHVYVRKEEYDLAIDECTNALKLNPFYPHIYLLRGAVYAEKGEYDQAIADFARTLKLAPDLAMGYKARGEVYAEKGEQDLAITDYAKALELNPDDTEAREKLETATRLRDTATEYDQAVQNTPQDPDVWHARGLHHLDDRQNYDQALADLSQAITLAPQNPEIYYDRARAHFALGDFLAADADYSSAITLDSANPLYWTERGRAHQRRAQHRNAITDLDQALTLNPAYTLAYQLRSISHAAIGNRQQAQTDYEMGKSLN